MSKIFVRERRKVEKGEKKARFRVVGLSGKDVKIYTKHIRKNELELIASSNSVSKNRQQNLKASPRHFQFDITSH